MDKFEEIKIALRNNEGNLGKVFRAHEAGITTTRELVENGAAANFGAAGNLQVTLNAILENRLPAAPSRAAQTGRAIGGLIRDNPKFSNEVKIYLQDLRSDLEQILNNEIAINNEASQFEKASEELLEVFQKVGGVYVYTYPTYFKLPVKIDPDRFWLKIGTTDRVIDLRIAEQTRATAVPEDPWVLRVYRSEDKTNQELEKVFHRMLEAAGHSRTDAKRGGQEWFATNLDFLDQIAVSMKFHIEKMEI